MGDETSTKYGRKVGSTTVEEFPIGKEHNAISFDHGRGRIEFDYADLDPASVHATDTITVATFDVVLEGREIIGLGKVHRIGPARLKFTKAALLSLRYECNADFAQEAIQIYFFDEPGGCWRMAKKVAQDLESRTITVEAGHFSDWIPGVGSYKVDEAGTLRDLASAESVDPYFGSLAIERDDVSVAARGVALAISSKFLSDALYEAVLPDFTAGFAGDVVHSDSVSHYRFAEGWNYKLPYAKSGQDLLEIQVQSRRVYKLSTLLSLVNSSGWFAAGYYVAASGNPFTLEVRIPEERAIVTCSVTITEYEYGPPGDKSTGYHYTPSNLCLYYGNGTRAQFNSTGQISSLTDAAGKNSLSFTWNSTSDPAPEIGRIAHSDGRAIKFYYFDESSKRRIVTLVSSDATSNSKIRAGDKFIGKYTLSSTSSSGRLEKYEALQTAALSDSDSFTLSAGNQSSYFSPLQSVTYSYSISSGVTGDYIQIQNHAGGLTKYIFKIGCLGRRYWSDESHETPRPVYEYLNKPRIGTVERKEDTAAAAWKKTTCNYIYDWNGTDVEVYTSSHRRYNQAPYDSVNNRTVMVVNGSTSSADAAKTRATSYFQHDSTTEEYKGLSQVLNEIYGGSWQLLNKTFNDISIASAYLSSFYVTTKSQFFSTNDTKDSGYHKYWNTWAYDKYGRVKQAGTRLGGGTESYTWYQYVGAHDSGDLDPYAKFSSDRFANPYSGDYQSRFASKHCMYLVGAIRKENNDTDSQDSVLFNSFDSSLNRVATRVVESTTLASGELFDPESGYSGGWRNLDTTFAYDATTNNLTSVTRPEGNVLSLSYGTGWKSSYVVKDQVTLVDNLGDPAEDQIVINAFDYDIKGRMTKRESYMTEDDGATEYSSDFPRQTLQYSYDGMDRMLSKSSLVGATETFLVKNSYDDSSRTVTSTDSLGFRTIGYYDKLYRLVRVEKYKPNVAAGTDWVDGAGGVSAYLIGCSETAYDAVYSKPVDQKLFTAASGRLTADPDHYALTHTHYDGAGRPVAEYYTRDHDGTERHLSDTVYEDSTNSVTRKLYEDDGSPASYTQTKVVNDWLGRGVVTAHAWTGKNAVGAELITTTTYDYAGRVVKVRLPNGADNAGEYSEYQFTSTGLLEKTLYPDGTFSIRSYNRNGGVAASLDRRGILSSFTYNNLEQVASQTVRGSPDLVMQMRYCHFGVATEAETRGTESIVATSRKYNSFGMVSELSQQVDGLTMKVQSQYDGAGVLRSMTGVGSGTGANAWSKTLYLDPQWHPTGDTYNYNFATVSPNSDGSSPIIKEASRFEGNLGVREYGSGKTVSFGYEEFLRLSGIDYSDASISDIALVRDFQGTIKTRDGTKSYTYAGMGRLATGEGSEYSYDKLSNLKAEGTKSWTYELEDGDTKNALYKNQMRVKRYQDTGSPSVDWQLSHDAGGNTVDIRERYKRLRWDGLNRLREVEFYADEGEVRKDRYWYGMGGLRVKRQEYTGLSGVSVQTVYYLYSGETVLLQESYEGTTIKETVFRVVVGGSVVASYVKSYPGGEGLKYYYLDNLGSRRAVTDSSGNVEEQFEYSIWGELVSGTPSQASFTGKGYDGTGLVYFNARYYDPILRRFLSEDPARKGTGWYTYCSNDPVNRTDPTGKDSLFATFDPNTQKMSATYFPSARDVGASQPKTYTWTATNNPDPDPVYSATNPAKEVYSPHFPAGTWRIQESKERNDNAFGPAFIPTLAHTALAVQAKDPQTGEYAPTGEMLETWGYGIHAGGSSVSDLTHGCIRMSAPDLQEFRELSDAALQGGGESVLTARPAE